MDRYELSILIVVSERIQNELSILIVVSERIQNELSILIAVSERTLNMAINNSYLYKSACEYFSIRPPILSENNYIRIQMPVLTS